MQVWPWEPNNAEPMVEEYGYLTDVMVSRNGTEQRRKLRRHPVGSLEFSFFMQGNEAFKASIALETYQADTWVVPLWQHARRLTSAVTAGDTTLYADTNYARFLDVGGMGRWALLWTAWDTYELVEVSDVTPTEVDIMGGTVASWATATTWLIPCRVARLADTFEVRWFARDSITGRLRFSFESAMTDDSVAAHVVIGGAVLPVP